MKLIIAGGRDYRLTDADRAKLDDIDRRMGVGVVLCGKCSGVDLDGEQWAFGRMIPVEYFPPDWKAHGKAAGPIRNRTMAIVGHAVALFPGGRGTQSMHDEAVKAGLRIFDFR